MVDDVPACFAAGTLVATGAGYQPIESVGVGDLIWSLDEITGELPEQRVIETFVRHNEPVLELVLSDIHGSTETVRATGEHPFWLAENGWVPARRLRDGDQILQRDGGWLRVSSATWTQECETVHNLWVDTTHTYFVGQLGAWVHNRCIPDLSLRDGTGKVHGALPRREELSRYSADDLASFRDDLRGSVQTRIQANAEHGPQGNHGLRQEQELTRTIDRLLGD